MWEVSVVTFPAFQHTAARRRLVDPESKPFLPRNVSTHSRPKAAGANWLEAAAKPVCFNTQPPEGGWGRLHL